MPHIEGRPWQTADKGAIGAAYAIADRAADPFAHRDPVRAPGRPSGGSQVSAAGPRRHREETPCRLP